MAAFLRQVYIATRRDPIVSRVARNESVGDNGVQSE